MIRVLIERHIANGMEHYYDSTIKRVVGRVVAAHGCISGESLKDSNNPGRRIVMSKWETLADWETWLASSQRRDVLREIAPLMNGAERITLLELTS